MKTNRFLLRYRSDIVAMVLYNLIAGFLTLVYEIWLGGATGEQWVWVRIIYTIIRVSGAFLLGYLIDFCRRHIWQKRKLIFKALADAFALSLYQIPIYIFSALISGVLWHSILITACLYIGDNLLLGWLYGYILDRVRRYYHNKQAKF